MAADSSRSSRRSAWAPSEQAQRTVTRWAEPWAWGGEVAGGVVRGPGEGGQRRRITHAQTHGVVALWGEERGR